MFRAFEYPPAVVGEEVFIETDAMQVKVKYEPTEKKIHFLSRVGGRRIAPQTCHPPFFAHVHSKPMMALVMFEEEGADAGPNHFYAISACN